MGTLENPTPAPQRRTVPTAQQRADAKKLADFVLFTQREVFLNISPELNKGNVSFPQLFLLTYLASEEYLTMGDIAKKMGHSTAAATGLVDRLERLKYVEREHSVEDRRKIMIRITEKGRELVAKMRGEIMSELSGIIQKDGPDKDPLDEVREIIGKRFPKNPNTI